VTDCIRHCGNHGRTSSFNTAILGLCFSAWQYSIAHWT